MGLTACDISALLHHLEPDTDISSPTPNDTCNPKPCDYVVSNSPYRQNIIRPYQSIRRLKVRGLRVPCRGLQNICKLLNYFEKIGRGGEIRTHDHLPPRQACENCLKPALRLAFRIIKGR